MKINNKIKKNSFILLLVWIPVVAFAGWNIEDVRTDAAFVGLTTDKSFGMIMVDAIGWMMGLLASLSMLMFVVAGMMYVTAGGDEETVGNAKKIIKYGITGMVIALSGFLIVEVISSIVGECSFWFFC